MAFVTIDENGVVTGIYAAAQPDLPTFAEIADADPRIATFLHRPLTTFKLAASDFLLRFTEDERAAMRAIALDVPQFADYLMQLQTVRYVDLLDNLVPAAMDALIGAGVIDSSRKTQILNPLLTGSETLV